MKKVLKIICCVLSGVLIGFFADQLNTVVGIACFTLGFALLVASDLISEKDNEDN